MRYSKKSIQDLKSIVDPLEVLTTLGGIHFSDLSSTSDEIRSRCPLHGGDNKTAFLWKRSSGTWKCFTHNCGSETSHDVFSFLCLKFNINFISAVELLARTFNFTLEEDNESYSSSGFSETKNLIKDYNLSKKYQINNLKELSYFPGYSKDNFDFIIKYLESRNYNYEKLKEFKLYPMIDSFKILRIGVPVYDDLNKLVGINARLMDTIVEYPTEVKDDQNNIFPIPKYRMTKFNKGSVLYNLNNAKDIGIKKGIIIVEGQFDVMRLHTYGYLNAVCTMGTSLTPQQVALLYKHCFHVTFLVEEGAAAEEGVIKSIKQLKYGMKVSIAKLPKGDADSNNKETIDYYLKNAITLSQNKLVNIITDKEMLPELNHEP